MEACKPDPKDAERIEAAVPASVSTESTAKKNYAPKSIGRWLVLLIEGVIIGVGAILPGISGGVLLVAFGIYKPMMELLSHPIKSIPKYYQLFIPVVLGWALGFLGLAGLISALATKNATLVTSVFIGLILGMFPSLFREGGKEGRTKSCWIALAVSTAALLSMFLFLQNGSIVQPAPSVGWFLFCGVLWGISLIVPGMSSSSLLLFLGLYYPMSEGLSRLDPAVVIPFLIGILATVLLLARAVNSLFQKHYGVMFHCVIGFVIASTIPIIPLKFSGTVELLLSIFLAAAGFFATFYLDRLSCRFTPAQTDKKPQA